MPPPAPVNSSDHQLLRAFAAGDQHAFAELLRRHERMVYSTALRVLGDDTSAAHDAAQQTFLLLAREARRLRPAVVLGGWLHQTALHQALTLRRSMLRRRLREHRAATDPALQVSAASEPAAAASASWAELAPLLDEALARLPERLRAAVVLCLLENQDRAAAAAQLGCSPEALAKRLARALEQLRVLLVRRHIALSAATLAALLIEHGSEAHAANLAPAVLATAPAPGATLPAGLGLKLGAGLAVVGAALYLALPPSTSPKTATSAPASPRPASTSPASAPSTATSKPVASHPPPPVRLAKPPTNPSSYVPPDNPYAPALALLDTWSPEDKAAAIAGKPVSEAARAHLPEFLKSLRAGYAAPEVDWGVDYSLGFRTTVPHVSALLAVAMTALEAGKALPPAQSAENALTVLALARHIGREGCLVEVASGINLTSTATHTLKALSSKLSPAEAREIASALRAMPTGGTLATVLAIEKIFFLDSFATTLREELLAALGPDAAPGQAPINRTVAALPDAPGELPPLRLSGVLQEGASAAISLEGPDGTFWLRPGETRDELTLLEASVERRRATLLFRGRPLLLDLESRRFHAPALALLEAAAHRLPKDSLCGIMLSERPHGSIADFLREMQDSARQVGELYAEAAADPSRFTDEAAYDKRLAAFPALARQIASGLPRLIKRLQEQQAKEAALLAALDARAADVASPRVSAAAP